jgi:hypothetical protein
MTSYAYGGSAGGPCTTNRVTGEHEHHYGSPGPLGLEFARPTPRHVLRAREAEVALAARSKLGRGRDLPLTTDVGRPPFRPNLEPSSGALDLERLALAHGFRAHVLTSPDLVTVEGMHEERRCAFRAYWTRNGADGGSWHEAFRYEYTHDTRPVGVDKTARVGLVGKRAPGVSEHHLVIAASPYGVKTNVTEIKKRIAS